MPALPQRHTAPGTTNPAMNITARILHLWKAFWQLGPRASLLYVLYQLAVRLRLYSLLTPARRAAPLPQTPFVSLAGWPSEEEMRGALGVDGRRALLAEADEILAGQVRLFGGSPVPLDLRPASPLWHWTYYKTGLFGGRDIKFIWEPARFGWATVLARAYHASGDEKYAEGFWLQTESFLTANPPNQGPNWVSAQEVALRLICLVFSLSLLKNSPHSSEARIKRVAAALAEHARRIPPTLLYARAQGNNHLLTEAAGLLTAAAVLPSDSQAARWRRLGLKWLNRGLVNQIAADGTYTQHSANYHRLMLHTALWANRLSQGGVRGLTTAARTRLAAAAEWLAGLLDPETGHVPNLGPNDGAHILPFTTQPFDDFRPTAVAARRAFCGAADDIVDELSLWVAPQVAGAATAPAPHLRLTSGRAWGLLRAARYTGRPGHADPLHVDLWWRGLNVARDAGTYLYNAKGEWANVLMGADVHNTLMVNGRQPMTRAGRFLWLDWAQADVLEQTKTRVAAAQDGYRALGVRHQRAVEVSGAVWRITDELHTQVPVTRCKLRLHWLLPDWPWTLDGTTLTLQSPHGAVRVNVGGAVGLGASLTRAGELLAGVGAVVYWRGWYSPTYSVKEPALSFAVEVESSLPIALTTEFLFPGD
ncbi:MAG: alginate lyase family protein [Anaerolineae bacterium]|nr:MAG: alginate lyase family protein [Anaerolineae bacterium]